MPILMMVLEFKSTGKHVELMPSPKLSMHTTVFCVFHKGPVKLMQWMTMAHSFLQSESNLLHYHFKFSYVGLHMAVKEFFETHF